ncbi:MAG: hypothetical protein Q8R47_02715 [Nanoarchaeota archaeon]|nr:hypothetical protein [Nanoarchaeota archaeon]
MAKKAVKKTVKPVKGRSSLRSTNVNSSRSVKAAKKKLPEVEENDDEELELHPAEEQGILADETSEEHELAMAIGDEDEDVYTEEGRKKLEEDDEIAPWEEGVMEGASGIGQLGKDALTGKPIIDADEVIEMELDGKLYRFVSEKNAIKFREKMMKKGKKK